MYTQTVQLTVDGKNYKIKLEYELGDSPGHVWASGTPTPPISYPQFLRIEEASIGGFWEYLWQLEAWFE